MGIDQSSNGFARKKSMLKIRSYEQENNNYDNNRLKVCFVSPYSYPLFNPESKTPFGGSEVRVSLLAKSLARKSLFDVSLIVLDHKQPHIEERAGVRIYSWREKPNPLLIHTRPLRDRVRHFAGKVIRIIKHTIWHSMPGTNEYRIGDHFFGKKDISIYDEIDADIYLLPGNSILSAELAFYCQQRGRKYVFLAGSDIDYDKEYRRMPQKRDIYGTSFALKAYAIKSAHAHIVQNERQARLLKGGYGRSSVLIRNPVDLELMYPRNQSPRAILWVGKSDERIKQPSIVLELARQLDLFEFVMIMNFAEKEIHLRCLEEAERLPNLTVIEYVPYAKIEYYFAEARLHLSTSVFEGFPNTFLQAAKYGVPTISLHVDPDGMLSKHGCGLASGGSFSSLKENIVKLSEDSSLYDHLSRKSIHYLREYHDVNLIVSQFEEAISCLAGNGSPG